VLEYSHCQKKYTRLGLDARTKRNNNSEWGQNLFVCSIYVVPRVSLVIKIPLLIVENLSNINLTASRDCLSLSHFSADLRSRTLVGQCMRVRTRSRCVLRGSVVGLRAGMLALAESPALL
jgi:hypothetical protein